jgi:non-specific serine/threonine protein kinase
VFLTSRGQPKILDFGLAKIERLAGDAGSEVATAVKGNELTKSGTTMGTVSYMSPEQARGQLTDARTDLFSLGAVLYQMATGLLPFPGETSAVIFDAILNREPPPLGRVNAGLPADLDRILSKDTGAARAARRARAARGRQRSRSRSSTSRTSPASRKTSTCATASPRTSSRSCSRSRS